MSIKIAIGLGNMGSSYQGTRHNIGMEVVARLAKSYGGNFVRNKYCAAYLCKARLGGVEVVFAAAEGYMNESGVNIANILKFLKMDISQAAIFYDDITLSPSTMKLTIGGSAGGHNGVDNILAMLGNTFARIRIGIGSKPFKTMDLADYVLAKPSAEDSEKLEALMPKIKSAFEHLVLNGIASAQNVYNAKS